MKSKNFFIAALFFLAGFISLLRTEPVEYLLSFFFFSVFLIRNILIKESSKIISLEQQDLLNYDHVKD